MRNKYSPAIALLRSLCLEVETLDDLRELKPELASALALLEECTETQQNRLDCFRVMTGKYESRPDVFSVRDVVERCLAKEREVLRRATVAEELSLIHI